MAHPSTHLTMKLRGYDLETMKITTADGAIVLADPEGNEAASWSFVGLMKHWNRKHNRAVYVPSIRRSMEDLYQYSYGNILRLGIGTDFLSFLSAMAQGFIYYDPGIKLVNASSEHPVMKKRSQFRIHSKHLSGLYRQFETVNVLNQ